MTSIFTFMTLFGASLAAASNKNSSTVQYAGVNLFGLANDASILGSAYSLFEGTNCNASFAAYPYLDPPQHYYDWHALGFNLFRLPLSWQHAQTQLGGPLNETTMQGLDGLINTITSNGSVAIIDIHNYARYYCSIIGQAQNNFELAAFDQGITNVTDDDFVDLWVKLASRYSQNANVMFQLMNEPHDLNITLWTATYQKVITAIREQNVTQPILVSGTQFARLTNWQDSSMAALSTLEDPADNLIFDFHQYFDDDGGSYGTCNDWTTFASHFQDVTNFLRGSGKTAVLTEFGGAPGKDCVALYHHLMKFFVENKDVWTGWTAWGSYLTLGQELSLNKSSPYYALTEIIAQYAPLR